MLIWSNDPYNSVWEYLNLFQSKDAVSRLLDGNFQSERPFSYVNNETKNTKAKQISYSIKQAYEYFKSAESVTINTSPLLYFYGMLALAKALILGNSPNTILSELNYHGLHSRPKSKKLKEYSEDKENWSIENEYAVTNNGVFQHLVKIIDGEGFPKDTIFTFKNLLPVNPELRDIFKRYYSEEPKNIEVQGVRRVSNNPDIIEVLILTNDRNEFEKNFPIFKKQFIFKELYKNKYLRYHSNEHFERPSKSFSVHRSIYSRTYLVAGTEYEHNEKMFNKFISPAINDYAGMFILSNCVRYKQDLWGKIVDGEAGGSLGVINMFISTAKIRFSTFVLSELLNEKIEFGTTARW
jgi:hypothetical protein